MDNYKANSNETIKEMLCEIHEDDISNLFSVIPQKAVLPKLNLPEGISELELQKKIKDISKENKTNYSYFIGAGAYKRFIPAAINQISSRFEFNTAYTPYQPEISQGTLQVIYEFQSMICDITGMEVCNASVYDTGSACAEAILMASRISGKKKFLVSSCINPEYKNVIKTYSDAGEIEIEELNNNNYKTDITGINEKLASGEYAGLLIQNPNFYGEIEDIDILQNIEKSPKTIFITCIEPISSMVLKKPSEYNTDIVIGDVQSFGNSLSFGGPYAGFIATLDKYKRQMPGRIVGRTLDANGEQAFTLTLQAREQHIRREKATSNICSNQGLAILNSVLYMALLGKKGISQAAYLSSKNAHILAQRLKNKGYNILNNNFFNEFVLEVKDANSFLNNMKNQEIIAGYKLDNTHILVCVTEQNTKAEIDNYIRLT